MDSGPAIFDISSDEEQGWVEPIGGGGDGDDYDWLTKLLDAVDKQKDDSDEVVVLGEIRADPSRQRTPKSWKSTAKDEDDDDCVVLDRDPDKLVDVPKERDDYSDELVVVGEKGQIACRDYPHPRHICAKFPFSTSPHEKHCDLCHCYVCDSLAPCVHWGNGFSSADHCHATDKEEAWNQQRRSIKMGKIARPPASRFKDVFLPLALPHLNQAPEISHASQQNKVPQINCVAPLNPVPQANQVPPVRTIHLDPNSLTQNPTSRQPLIRACSSTNIAASSITSQERSPQPGYVMAKNRFQPRLIGRGLHVGSTLQRSRGHDIPPSVIFHPVFKRLACSRGASSRNHYMPRSVNNYNRAHTLQLCGDTHPVPRSNDKSSTSRPWLNLDSHAQRSSPHPNGGNSFANSGLAQPQFHTQSTLSYVGTNNQQHENQALNPMQYDGQTASHHENLSQDIAHQSSQNIYQHGYQIQNAMVHGSLGFDFGWINNYCPESNQQLPAVDQHLFKSSQQGNTESLYLHSEDGVQIPVENVQLHCQIDQPAVENVHLQSTEPEGESSSAKEFDSQQTESTKLGSSGIDPESLIIEDPSNPVALDYSVPLMNILSPEASSIANMLYFDFEASWNSLTHA